jgi:hypothetical protein
MGLFVGFICWFYLLVLFVIYFTAVALATAKKEGCEGHFVEPLVLRSALERRVAKGHKADYQTLDFSNLRLLVV